MTPSTWSALRKVPGTIRAEPKRIQQLHRTSKNDALICKRLTMAKTTSKNNLAISGRRMDKTTSICEMSTSNVRLAEERTCKNIIPEGSSARQTGIQMPVECYSLGCLSESCDRERNAKNTNDSSVPKRTPNSDLDKLSVKSKKEGKRSSENCTYFEPIHGLNRLNNSNVYCDSLVDPVGSQVLNYSVGKRSDLKPVFPCTASESSYPPVSRIFPFSLLKYPNPPTIVLNSDGTILSQYANSDNQHILDNSMIGSKESNCSPKDVMAPAEASLVPHQSSAVELRTSISEDLKAERTNGKIAKLWRPFLDENSESRPSSSTGSTEIHVPMPHYVRLREEFKSIAMANSPLGIGVLRGSLTSSFRPVRRKRSHCNFCQMSFNNNGQLAGHMRIHTGDKPFQCESCAKAFARNEELTRHKRIHSGHRPHVCDICSKKFGRKDHLNKHRKTHLKTSEKKIFHCRYEGCGHSYTRSDALTRHQSTAHNIRHTQQSCRGAPRARQAIPVLP